MSLSRIYKKNNETNETIVRPLDLNRSVNPGGEAVIAVQNFNKSSGTGKEGTNNYGTPLGPSYSEKDIEKSPLFQQKINSLEKAEARFNEATKALAAAVEKISELSNTIYANSTQDMLRLVMAISRKIVQSEISIKEDIILATINQALQAAMKSDEFHIKVNPDDFSLVIEKKPLFMASISGLNNIVFEADPNISRGGCIIESNVGQVDATIETKLEEMHQHLLDSVANNIGTPG